MKEFVILRSVSSLGRRIYKLNLFFRVVQKGSSLSHGSQGEGVGAVEGGRETSVFKPIKRNAIQVLSQRFT